MAVHRAISVSYTHLFAAGHDLSIDNVSGTGTDAYHQALQMESTEALEKWLLDLCRHLQREVLHERQDSTKSFVQSAEEYVKTNYADQDLSVEVICKKLNVSAAYFSTIFKKETGKTLSLIHIYPLPQCGDRYLRRFGFYSGTAGGSKSCGSSEPCLLYTSKAETAAERWLHREHRKRLQK